MKPTVSIVVVNHNGRKWLEGCFESIRAQEYRNLEVILVDNGSSDGSAEMIRSSYPEVKIIESPENLGFAGGCNAGMHSSSGDFLLLLNNDARLEADFLDPLLGAFDEIERLGVVQPRIVLLDDPARLHQCGHFWTDSACLYYYGFGKSAGLPAYNSPFPVFACTGAAMLIKREVLEEVGLFDEDFWCYYEDIDFCHRAWLAGYECWYYPLATARHSIGATATRFDEGTVRYHFIKNWLASMLKNFEGRTLATSLPMFLLSNFLSLAFRFLQGDVSLVLPFLRALRYDFARRRTIIDERKAVQSIRKVSDIEVFRRVKRNPRLSYYYYLNRGLEDYRD